MATHRAFRLHSYGGPECIQLDTVLVPTPGPSQVLVSIRAVGMNPFDCKIREGYVRDMLPLQLPTILGADFVGSVAALGPDTISGFKVGDRVMSISTSLGAYAENIVVDEKILARIPDTLNDIEAATLPMPAGTAYAALYTAGPIYPGMDILIHGASGTARASAVQSAKAEGARVVATASGKNRDYVLGLGADEFIDCQKEKFEEKAKDIDPVLDFVLIGGAMNTTSRSWSVLKSNGAIVSLSDPAILGNIPTGFRGFFPTMEAEPRQYEQIADELATGQIRSKIARVFGQNELVVAMEINKAGGITSRLIVESKRVWGSSNLVNMKALIVISILYL